MMNDAPEKVWLDVTSEDEDGFFIVEAEKRHGNMDVEYVRSDIDAKGRNHLTDMKKYYRIEPSFKDGLYFPETTRFEVIDDEGRTYVKYDCEVKLAFQDDGQTIKMFVSKNTEDRKNS